MKRAYNYGKGKTMIWLCKHVTYAGDNCLIWPFSRLQNGYGNFGFKGKIYYAHRYMCQLAHGNPLSSKHEAAHNCGKGHLGCCNPKHLAWKTKSQNRNDSKLHGTHYRNQVGRYGKLKPEQVRIIKSLKGKRTQAELAKQFNISIPSIEAIHNGRTHKHC